MGQKNKIQDKNKSSLFQELSFQLRQMRHSRQEGISWESSQNKTTVGFQTSEIILSQS